MQRNGFCALAVLCAVMFLGATSAQAATVGPVLLTLTPGDGITNEIDVTMTLGAPLTDTSTASGTLELNLYGTFGPASANVAGLGFIQ